MSLLKFCSADYLSSLRKILSTQHLNLSQNTSALSFLRSNFGSNLAKFVNLTHRDPSLYGTKFGFKEFLNFMSKKLSSRKFELSL